MIRAPEIGKIIYRTATIPIITMSGTFDPFKPKDINGDHCFHLSTIQLVKEGRILTKIKTITLTLQKICSHDQSDRWNGCLPANMKGMPGETC
jgi:hypothetical protein